MFLCFFSLQCCCKLFDKEFSRSRSWDTSSATLKHSALVSKTIAQVNSVASSAASGIPNIFQSTVYTQLYNDPVTL